MHDITELESMGIPGVFVASTAFIDAAAAQSVALGFEPAAVFVPHPIQDRTDDEVRAIADGVVQLILDKLTG